MMKWMAATSFVRRDRIFSKQRLLSRALQLRSTNGSRAGRLQHSGSRYGFDGFRFEQPREPGVAHLCSIARGIDGRTVLARSAIAHSGAFRGHGGERHARARSHHAIGSRGRPRDAFGAVHYRDPIVAFALPGTSRDTLVP